MTFGPAMKHDVQRETTEVHDYGKGRMTAEPVFVRKNGAVAEDEGWILSYVYDPKRDLSDVVILDAQDFAGEPVATIRLTGSRAVRLPRRLGARQGHPCSSRRRERWRCHSARMAPPHSPTRPYRRSAEGELEENRSGSDTNPTRALRQGHHRGCRHDGFAGRLADGVSRQACDRVRRHPRGFGKGQGVSSGVRGTLRQATRRDPEADRRHLRSSHVHHRLGGGRVRCRPGQRVRTRVPVDQGILLARGVQARAGAHRVHHQHLHVAAERVGRLRRPATEIPRLALCDRRLGLQHRRSHGPSRHRPGGVRARAEVRRGNRARAHPHSEGTERLRRQQPARAVVLSPRWTCSCAA